MLITPPLPAGNIPAAPIPPGAPPAWSPVGTPMFPPAGPVLPLASPHPERELSSTLARNADGTWRRETSERRVGGWVIGLMLAPIPSRVQASQTASACRNILMTRDGVRRATRLRAWPLRSSEAERAPRLHRRAHRALRSVRCPRTRYARPPCAKGASARRPTARARPPARRPQN